MRLREGLTGCMLLSESDMLSTSAISALCLSRHCPREEGVGVHCSTRACARVACGVWRVARACVCACVVHGVCGRALRRVAVRVWACSDRRVCLYVRVGVHPSPHCTRRSLTPPCACGHRRGAALTTLRLVSNQLGSSFTSFSLHVCWYTKPVPSSGCTTMREAS
eukprot:1465242-Prymnesium_polylepis.1